MYTHSWIQMQIQEPGIWNHLPQKHSFQNEIKESSFKLRLVLKCKAKESSSVSNDVTLLYYNCYFVTIDVKRTIVTNEINFFLFELFLTQTSTNTKHLVF